ncbi:MAG: aa3-type cytochrome c oxidase subunit IV [Alphaproteobacteria bacterium]|nr:aa3-type cytochrome c oxidase subunit IV [Alphaproteobacteria bacterium]MCD8520212.1 aa3-type cytochrome c oxidase subunit IV [Alphaproteobacteria bacterium]MCD8526081.1 aa3-type cytochrome c oxidase subunit IV [Alphaproteobacteria bacterium]MCD8570977.1 aa3-type cytochrome c oxidase subunit IV [Alphaproteobacteria bacterium]
MAKTTKVSVDPQELKKAQHMWGVFTEMTKWGVIATVAVLVIMAATLL